MHVINHEWNRFMFVAFTMCFVWDTKLDLPSIYMVLKIGMVEESKLG